MPLILSLILLPYYRLHAAAEINPQVGAAVFEILENSAPNISLRELLAGPRGDELSDHSLILINSISPESRAAILTKLHTLNLNADSSLEEIYAAAGVDLAFIGLETALVAYTSLQLSMLFVAIIYAIRTGDWGNGLSPAMYCSHAMQDHNDPDYYYCWERIGR